MAESISPTQIIDTIEARFKPDKAGALNSVVQFDLSGDRPMQFTVIIENGKCSTFDGLVGTATCTVKAKSQHYVALELGELNPQLAIIMGKVKVSDINEMLRFSKCFRSYKSFVSKPAATSEGKKRKPDSGPLVGFRILDLSRLLPGPWATAMLADMGAEVIKIEDPDAPDYVRNYPPLYNGKSANYMAWNRSKRSLALSLRSADGRAKFLDLVKSADVVVEQYRPGILASWGIDYSVAKAVNPKIIYASLTGYGQHGPFSQAAGHDLNYLALSGVLSQNKDANGRPIIPGVQFADIASGTYLTVQGIMAALLSRMMAGEGQHVDIAMTDGLLPLATIPLNEMWAGEHPKANGHSALSGLLPNYNVYETADGRWMALGALEPKFWSKFCAEVGHPEWTECALPGHPQLETTRLAVAALFKSQPRSYWEQLGTIHDFCLTPVLELDELQSHAHFQFRNSFNLSHGFPLINQPIVFGSTPSKVHWEAPELGEDSI